MSGKTNVKRTGVWRRILLPAGLLFLLPAPTVAGDWPQILGPQRNGQAEGEKLAASWPAAGPKTVWQKAVGSGFSGVAVAGGKVIVFHRVENQELVEALDAKTGKPLWKQGYPASHQASISPDDGPRAVPVVDQGNVYVFGAAGDLHSLVLETGEKRWSRPLAKDYEAPEGYFGFGSTPIVEGDKLLLNVGGKGAGLVAVSLASGKTVWKGTDEGASSSFPVAATIAGVRHLIFITRLNLVSVDPASGNVRFQLPFGKRGPTVNGANPLVLDGHVFAAASYNVGALWARIGKAEFEPVWQNDEVMSSQYTTCVAHQGILYGIDGREDIGVAKLRALDPKTGKALWTQDGFGMATLILADGKLVILKTSGRLILAQATDRKYQELGSAQILDTTTRALPALSNGLLYARDTATLKCVDLGGP